MTRLTKVLILGFALTIPAGITAVSSLAASNPVTVLLHPFDVCDGDGPCNSTWNTAPGMPAFGCSSDDCTNPSCTMDETTEYEYCVCTTEAETIDCHARHYFSSWPPRCEPFSSCGTEGTCSPFFVAEGVKCCKCIWGT
jgi:hypothetical protein